MKIIIALLIIFIGGAIVGFWWWQNSVPGELDVFAKCLSEKGLKFYGAFWCNYCRNQKAMFGSSQKYLPYIECSTPDGKGQLQTCSQAGINSYPTWEFADGSRQKGEVPLKTLAEKTSCPLPQ